MHRTRVGVVSVGCDSVWGLTGDLECRLKETPGSRHVPGLAQPTVHQVPDAINGPVEVAPPASYFHVGFVHVPTASDGPSTASPQRIGDHRGESLFPCTNGLMGER